MSLHPREASFDIRGFDPAHYNTQLQLEKVIETFIEGYNACMDYDEELLTNYLNRKYDNHHVGFAYEGTGLYFGLLDLMFPKKTSRLAEFTQYHGANHDYIISVGAGFAFARVPFAKKKLRAYMKKLDPLLAWCIPDGLGFHEGIFKHETYIEKQKEIPQSLAPEFHQLFNSGIGRSIWWVKGADPFKIKIAISEFPKERQAELWCGVGVAHAYAGGASESDFPTFINLANDYAKDFLSGIPFACQMRRKGNNMSGWTEKVSQQLLQKSTTQTADWVMDLMNQALSLYPQDEMLGVRAYQWIRQELVRQLNHHAHELITI